MSAAITAAVVTAGVGAYSAYSSAEAGAQAADASKRANALAQQNLANQQQQLTQWNDIFGNTEQNLAKFYSSLTPEHYSALGIQSNQQASAKAKENITTTFAQKGLTGSGAELAALANVDYATAKANAETRRTAEEQSSAKQMEWYAQGQTKYATINNTTQSAYNMAVSSENAYAKTLQGYADTTADTSGQFLGKALNYALTRNSTGASTTASTSTIK